jgi:Leucine-rich repeat (LRR) protein
VTNRDKKDKIRGRVADAGEPFNVARRKIEAAAAGRASKAEFHEIMRTGRCDLSNRELTVLPPGMTGLTNLWELRLGGNQLTALPPEIGQLTELWELRLDGNQLTALPPEISQLVNLRELGLRGNQLTALPPEISQLTSLERLGLGRNQLTALPPEIGQLTNLLDLRLDGNRLTALPRELADLLSGGLNLRLAGNPLQGAVLELYGQGPHALASYLRSLSDRKSSRFTVRSSSSAS